MFFAFAVGSEVEGGVALADGGIGEDIPVVGGDEVGGEEIDGARSVAAVLGAANAEAVSAFGMAAHGAFDLHAEDGTGVFDADVVAGEAAVGAGDFESLAGGESHEVKFGPGSALARVLDATA